MIAEPQSRVDHPTRVYDALALALVCGLGCNVALYHLAKPALEADPIYDFPTYYFAYQAWQDGQSPYDLAHIQAAARARNYDGELLYFLYPPGVLVLLAPLFSLFDYAGAYRVWLLLSHAALVAATVCWIRLRGGPLRAVQNVALAAMALAFWPVYLTFDLGQINVFLYLLLVLAFCGHARHWPPAVVAALLVLAACIKVIPVIFFAVFLIRGDWRTLAFGLLWSAVAVVAQGLALGWHLWNDFLAMLAHFSGTRYAILTNVSLKGYLWRLADAGYLPNDTAVAALHAALAGALVVGCLAALLRRRQANLVLQGGLLLVTFFLVSSPTSSHHLTLLLLVYAGLVDVVTHPRTSPWLFAAVAGSFLLNGLYWGQYQLAGHPWTAPFQSMATYGLLSLYGSLVYVLVRGDGAIEWRVLPRSPVGTWADETQNAPPVASRVRDDGWLAAYGIQVPAAPRPGGRSVGYIVGLVVTMAGLAAGIYAFAPRAAAQEFGSRQKLALAERAAVGDVVVLAPDASSFLREIANWTATKSYPVLLDDPYWSRLFIERFRPARIVVAPPEGRGIVTPALARRALLASWSDGGLDDVADDSEEAVRALFARQTAPPIGMVLVGANSNAAAAGVALAAGHRQPIAFLPGTLPTGTRSLSLAAAHTVDSAVRQVIAQQGWELDGLWNGIDVVTLVSDLPLQYDNPAATAAGDEALDDLLLRGDGLARDAFVGRLYGSPEQAVYQAMCSLFLHTERLLSFSVYEATGRPMERSYQDDLTLAACPPGIEAVSSGGVGTREHWRELVGRRNPFDLVLVCSGGAEASWVTMSGVATTEDLPLSGPAAVYWVHSWAAKKPWDLDTLAGRWLASGAFVFYGSAAEPYLSAFPPPYKVLRAWTEGLPFVAACRLADRPPWRLVYLGDPLFRYRERPPARVPQPRGVSLQDEIARLAREAGAAFDGPVGAVQTLALRRLQVGDATGALAVTGVLLEGQVAGPRAREVAALAVLAAHARGDDALVVETYQRHDVSGKDPADHPGAYVVYLDSMRTLATAAAQAGDVTRAEELYRRLATFRPASESVRKFAQAGLDALGLAP